MRLQVGSSICASTRVLRSREGKSWRSFVVLTSIGDSNGLNTTVSSVKSCSGSCYYSRIGIDIDSCGTTSVSTTLSKDGSSSKLVSRNEDVGIRLDTISVETTSTLIRTDLYIDRSRDCRLEVTCLGSVKVNILIEYYLTVEYGVLVTSRVKDDITTCSGDSVA